MQGSQVNVALLGWFRMRHMLAWPLRLRGSPIGLRLFLAFQVVILLTGLIGILAVSRFNALVATTSDLDSHDMPEVVILGRLRTSLYELRRHVVNLGASAPAPASADESSPGILADSIRSDRASLLALEQAAVASGMPTKDAGAVNDLLANLAIASDLTPQIDALAAAGRLAEARGTANTRLLPAIDRGLASTEALRASELVEAAAATANARQEAAGATRLVLLLTIASVIVSAGLAAVMTRSLVRPLTELLRATEAFTAGDLEASPRVASRDELGRLARSFDTIRGVLRQTIASLEGERRQTQAIIDATADGIVLVDSRRRVLQMNPAAQRLSGWSVQSALGRYCWDVFGCHGGSAAEAEAHEARCPLVKSCGESGELPVELHAKTRDGQRRWLAATAAPVPRDPGDEPRFVIGFRDVSQFKAVDQMKSDFVAMVSHELRAPLTTVAGAVETLALLDHEHDRGEYDEVVMILQQQTQRLRSVVAEVLQLTRLEAGRLQVHLEAVDVRDYLHRLLDDVRREWFGDGRELTLRVLPDAPLVWADPGLLDIVVRNLLDNAQKYTPSGSPVEVVVSSPPVSGTVQIRVRDHGPGIPADQRETIFDRFARGAALSGDSRGYGLGLYIARELMKAINGEIWVESSDDGACFALSLVATAADAGDAA